MLRRMESDRSEGRERIGTDVSRRVYSGRQDLTRLGEIVLYQTPRTREIVE